MLKIVVACDLSDRSERALRRAILLARPSPVALTVLHVAEPGDHAAAAQAAAALQQSLAHAHAGPAPGASRIEHVVTHGDACERIIQFAQAADLLVLGEPRRQTLREFFIGSTAHRILKRVATPALVVRTPAAEAYQRPVFAVDFSPGSIRAIQAARALGLGSDAGAVVHVFDSPGIGLMVETASYPMSDIKAHIRDKARKIERKLKRLMKQSGLPGRPVAILEKNGTASSLLAFARAFQADLIVLGSRGRPAIAKITLGSVAEQTLVHAACDILLVPPVPAAGSSRRPPA